MLTAPDQGPPASQTVHAKVSVCYHRKDTYQTPASPISSDHSLFCGLTMWYCKQQLTFLRPDNVKFQCNNLLFCCLTMWYCNATTYFFAAWHCDIAILANSLSLWSLRPQMSTNSGSESSRSWFRVPDSRNTDESDMRLIVVRFPTSVLQLESEMDIKSTLTLIQ